jgi:hypothetical protein
MLNNGKVENEASINLERQEQKGVARGGFDPPTLGLWALCASSAPSRLSTSICLLL